MKRKEGNLLQGWRLAAVVLAALALIWSPIPAQAATDQAAEVVGDETAVTEKQPVDVAAITAAVKLIKENGAVRIVPEHRLLYDNGPLVNSPGTGVGGADESVLQTSLGMNTLGFGDQYLIGNRMADDFEVTDVHWNILQIHLFAYQTGAAIELSTITGVYLQIWDGPPNDPASKVVWGDLTTNRLVSSTWSGIYRLADNSPGSTSRPIMLNVVNVDTTLKGGTYWLDWMTDGTLASGPWAPPITVTGQTTTGNALQYTTSSGVWNLALDGLAQQGMPFVIYGKFPWIIMNAPITGGGVR
ncbi:MAG: hypothetical protein ACYDBT_10590 [Desulfobulbaceae bacterium]